MITLFIIADDFTGALDTGVQFAACGAVTRVVTDLEYDFSHLDAEVLVLNASTRHMTAGDARATVAKAVRMARAGGIPYLYKKTDSALRGNIGGELQGVLDGADGAQIHFIPALPQMGRVTVNGVHYVDGQPVAEGVFGQDPFEPVRSSDVREIISAQTDTPIYCHANPPADDERFPAGIHLYDAASDEALSNIARQLQKSGQLTLIAGCAGFAATLPRLLKLEGPRPPKPKLNAPLFVVCGSVNPITRLQLNDAEKQGFTRIRLTPEQTLYPAWLESEECRESLAKWTRQLASHTPCLLDANDTAPDEARDMAGHLGLTTEELRVRISTTLGSVLKRLLDRGVEGTLLLTGGDTLLAFMGQIGVAELTPTYEIAPGVVLSQFCYREKEYRVISKSGGFGEKTLFSDLARSIAKNEQSGGREQC